MKNLMIALLGIGLSLTVNAQYSPCVTINANTFAMNPQIYTVNYYGVTITLDQDYDQSITVSGNLYPVDKPELTTPFSITIPANTLTYSTSDMYYQTTPVYDDAGVTISSITPSTVTSNSVYYSTQCVLTGYPEIPPVINSNNSMEYYGSIHNQGLVSIMPTVNFSTATVAWFEQASASYLKSQQGIDTTGMAGLWASGATSHIPDPSYDVFSDDPDSLVDVIYANSSISLTDKNYLYEMVHIMDSLVTPGTDPNITVYNSLCTALINLESTITNDGSLSASDKQILLSAAATIRYSSSFWGNYISYGGTLGDRGILEGNLAYVDMRSAGSNGFTATGPYANADEWLFHISWKGLFRADFGGFISGFIKGLITGPGALEAGAINGLATSGAYAIIGDN